MPCLHSGLPTGAQRFAGQWQSGSGKPRAHVKASVKGLRQQCRAAASGGDSNISKQQQAMQHEASLQEVAEQCFQADSETQAKLQRLGNAAAQVAALQAAQAELAAQMRQAGQLSPEENRRLERQQAQAASERGVQADVVQAAEDVQAALNELVEAEADKAKWQASIDEAEEKVESVKAAAIAAAGGGLASLPYLLTAGQAPLATVLSAAVLLASCTLFGVTFRYAVRQDLQNLQLKAGVVAAFGLVRGAAQADMLQLAVDNPFQTDLLAKAALEAGESVLTFAFAAVALELAFRNQQLQPFGFTVQREKS